MGRRDRLLLSALGAGWVLGAAASARRFARAAADPERAQALKLRQFLRENAATAYGRRHEYEKITTVAEYQARVPVVGYEELSPWIERIARGEPAVLTTFAPRMMERSTGSTSAQKLIPYTERLLEEFSAATGPWLFDLHTRRPRSIGRKSYWSISPAARRQEKTEGGLPIGFADDTEYFGPVERWALGKMMAVPGSVARAPDLQSWRRETALHLLAEAQLGLISVWSPTFLTLLMEWISEHGGSLLAELPKRRAEQLRRIVEHHDWRGDLLWPDLVLISCWTEADAARFLPELVRWFPGVELQGKGLLATEGVVSFPLLGVGSVAAVSGHFLEWIDLGAAHRPPLLSHQLRVGGEYSPVMTTGAGFARYHLKDVVRCVGHHKRAPILAFEGKLDRVSDLCGEKLNAAVVDRAIETAARATGIAPRFALLAPSLVPSPHYRLFLESDAPEPRLAAFGREVESELSRGHHYKYCRDLGQLSAVEPVRVRDGARRFEAALTARGMKAGDIKPARLDSRPAWDGVFS